MANKTAPTRLIIILGGIFFLVVVLYTTYQQMRHEYEVCVTFNGGTHCATARGATPEEAIHSAHDIDCGMLANGRDENIVCGGTQPTSVREVK
jgi:Na+/glutamate symporter